MTAEAPPAETAPARRSPSFLIDLGSGGGFPGIPLAAACPKLRVSLVESVVKKARFLGVSTAATNLADRVDVRAQRAESVAADGGALVSADVVTARAVGPLDDLVELALPLLRVGGRLLAWKRGEIDEELRAGARASSALGGTAPEPVPTPGVPELAGHVIVVVKKLAATPPGFPRDPAARRRRRW